MRKLNWFPLRILVLAGALWWSLSFAETGQARREFPQPAGLEPQKVYASTQPGAPCLNGEEIKLEVWNVGAAGGEQYEEVIINGKRKMGFTFSGGENGYIFESAYQGKFNTLDEYLQYQNSDSGNTIKEWWQFVDGVKVEQRIYWKNFGEDDFKETVRCGLAVENPQAFQPSTAPTQPPVSGPQPGTSPENPPATTKTANPNLPLIAAVILVGGAVLVVTATGGILVIKALAPRTRPPTPGDAASAIRAWQRAAKQAEREAENYIQQWEKARQTGDPNDPGYQALEKQYRDYIQHQRQRAAEARQKAGEIEASEREFQREERQQQAYRRHREAESGFIQQESQRQAQRQGGFDRQMDQAVRQNQQKQEQRQLEQKQARLQRERDLIESRMKVNEAESRMYQSFAAGHQLAQTGLEYIKAGADFAIDVGANLNPMIGKMIKSAYKLAAGTAGGVGEALADPKNWGTHVLKGAARGVLDVGADKLKSGAIKGLPSPVRTHPFFRGVKVNTDPVRISTFLEQTGRSAALQRAIFNTACTKLKNQINPIMVGKEMLKEKLGK
jgi:hypothetical protein